METGHPSTRAVNSGSGNQALQWMSLALVGDRKASGLKMPSRPKQHLGYFLKQLGHSGALHEDLLCFYSTVLLPVFEYASPVCHSSLTSTQTEVLETLQRRAMKIINADDCRS